MYSNPFVRPQTARQYAYVRPAGDLGPNASSTPTGTQWVVPAIVFGFLGWMIYLNRPEGQRRA